MEHVEEKTSRDIPTLLMKIVIALILLMAALIFIEAILFKATLSL